MAELYPMKFEPIFVEKIWGGNRLRKCLGKTNAPDNCGESWEISAIQERISVVKNGFLSGNTLEEIIDIYMGELVGERVYETFGDEFPLLIKFIDANEVLSVQVHPDDELAGERHHAYGKTEMWYVVESDEGFVYTGFNKEIGKQTLKKHIENNTVQSILNKESAHKGDVFFIPAGRIHATGAGVLFAEIQQTSDITYRVYDWDRRDERGKGRELHVDLALEAIDYKLHDQYKTLYSREEDRPVELSKCKYFTSNLLEITKPYEAEYNEIDSFVLYICLEGKAKIECYNGVQESIQKGETVLIPASIELLKVLPMNKTKLLEVFIDDATS